MNKNNIVRIGGNAITMNKGSKSFGPGVVPTPPVLVAVTMM
jgi:hypothetical protein